jgi:hypothetical protein
MKTNSRLRKIRIIMQPKGDSAPVLGVVLPPNLKHWLDISVYVRESGTCIILESGCKAEVMSKTQLRDCSKKIGEIYI